MFGGLLKRKQPNNVSSTLANPSEQLVSALLGALRSQAGVNVNDSTVLGLAVAYSCVNVISETLATLPVRLYQSEGRTKRVAREHPLNSIVGTSPNAEMTSVDFRRAMQGHLSLHNIAYAEIMRDGLGNPVGLYPIHPANIIARRRTDSAKTLYYQLQNELSGEREAKDILDLKGFTQNGIVGLDPTGTLKDVFGLAQALELNAMKFFANGSRLGTVLEHPAKLSEPAFNRLKESFEEEHQGADNAYKFKILEEGMKLVQSRSSNNDSQFDESRSRQALDVCRVFRVPPHKIQILENATFSNIEEQQIDWVADCIMPKAITWETSMNAKLLTSEERAAGYYFKLDLRGLLRGKMQERAEYYSKMVTMGAMSPNEVRELEDMDPVENLDIYLRPLNTEIAATTPFSK